MSIRDLGFTDKNINALVRQTDPAVKELYAKKTEIILDSHQEGIGRLMEATGMKPENITSMMSTAGNKLDSALRDLASYPTRMALTQLQSELGFEAKQLSSLLSGGGKYVGSMATTLGRKGSIEIMKSFKEEFDLAPKTLSSLLKGQGQWVGEDVKSLGSDETKDIFKSFLEIGVQPKNISAMINGAGGGLDSKLDILMENKPKLAAMVETHSPNAISSKINATKGNLQSKIDKVYEDLLTEMSGEFSPLEGGVAGKSASVIKEEKKQR